VRRVVEEHEPRARRIFEIQYIQAGWGLIQPIR
jgi:hypothetical protein